MVDASSFLDLCGTVHRHESLARHTTFRTGGATPAWVDVPSEERLIEALSYLQGGAFSIAAASTVGKSVGAQKYKLAKLKNWEANRIAVLIMACMGLIFFFFPYLLLRLFTQDLDVLRLGTLFLKIVAVMQVPLAITMVLEGSLKGAGDTRFLLLVTMAGMWVVRVPLSSLFSYVLGLPLVFVWGVMVVDWFTRMTILLLRYRSERWQEARVIR